MDLLEMTQRGFDAFNNRTFRETLTDDIDPNIVTVDVPLGLELQGRDAYLDYNDGFVTAMPDIQTAIVSPEISGNTLKATGRSTGTFTGELEKVILRAPEQYFWLHNRWKHEPPTRKRKARAA